VQVYVQHKMKDCGESLCEALLERGGYLFVCGDGLDMASDVHATIKGILQTHGGLDAQESDEVLRDMAAEKRYMKDVWI
jgi:sulfite reductase alpha subunit-like flavoprotein